MGEYAPREHTELERRAADRLADDLAGSPLVGRPLRLRLRNFSFGADRYVVSIAGPPSCSRRLRQIEDEIEAHEAALAEAWAELSLRYRREPHELARRWRAAAAGRNFHAVNDLIEKHNLYYPAEARLPMDPRTGDFVLVGGAPYRLRPLDDEWVLERFPLSSALAA